MLIWAYGSFYFRNQHFKVLSSSHWDIHVGNSQRSLLRVALATGCDRKVSLFGCIGFVLQMADNLTKLARDLLGTHSQLASITERIRDNLMDCKRSQSAHEPLRHNLQAIQHQVCELREFYVKLAYDLKAFSEFPYQIMKAVIELPELYSQIIEKLEGKWREEMREMSNEKQYLQRQLSLRDLEIEKLTTALEQANRPHSVRQLQKVAVVCPNSSPSQEIQVYLPSQILSTQENTSLIMNQYSCISDRLANLEQTGKFLCALNSEQDNQESSHCIRDTDREDNESIQRNRSFLRANNKSVTSKSTKRKENTKDNFWEGLESQIGKLKSVPSVKPWETPNNQNTGEKKSRQFSKKKKSESIGQRGRIYFKQDESKCGIFKL